MTTWKEFKQIVEAQGLKDDQVILYIDWNNITDPVVALEDPTWIESGYLGEDSEPES